MGELIVNYVMLWKYFHIRNFYELHLFVSFLFRSIRCFNKSLCSCNMWSSAFPPKKPKTVEHELFLSSVWSEPVDVREAAIKAVLKSEWSCYFEPGSLHIKMTFSCDIVRLSSSVLKQSVCKTSQIHRRHRLHELMVNVSKRLLLAGLAQSKLYKVNLTSTVCVCLIN